MWPSKKTITQKLITKATLMLSLLLLHSITQADTLFSAQHIDLWDYDCNGCRIEAQFDVKEGEIVHLKSRNELVLYREFDVKKQETLPTELNWQWSVETFVDPGVLARVTLYIAGTEEWPSRVLHYLWDAGRSDEVHEVISDFEHVLVVTGIDAKAEQWQIVNRDLLADWQRLYGGQDPIMPAIEAMEISLSLPEGKPVTGVFWTDLIVE